MLTLRRVVLERNTNVKNWVENCRNKGIAILARHILERFLKTYDITKEEFNDFIHSEYGFELVINEGHYIMSRSKLHKIF
jgi:hypothetical protein